MQVLDLGTRGYEDAWALQKQLLERRARGEIEDTLVLVEHPAVYTVGRSGGGDAERGAPDRSGDRSVAVAGLGRVPVLEVERGGKLTFHGPGQLVGYPIFALPHHDLRRYLRDVERVLMDVVTRETGLVARPCPESLLLEPGQLQTGVWVADRKIASIGIAVRKWVAYHGFALNLSTDLRYFLAVSPCGFQGSVMSSVEALLKSAGANRNAAARDELAGRVRSGLVRGFRQLSSLYAPAQSVGALAPISPEL